MSKWAELRLCPLLFVDAEVYTFEYTYDGNGNLKTKTDADGYVTIFSYNALDLVASINYNNDK